MSSLVHTFYIFSLAAVVQNKSKLHMPCKASFSGVYRSWRATSRQHDYYYWVKCLTSLPSVSGIRCHIQPFCYLYLNTTKMKGNVRICLKKWFAENIYLLPTRGHQRKQWRAGTLLYSMNHIPLLTQTHTICNLHNHPTVLNHNLTVPWKA